MVTVELLKQVAYGGLCVSVVLLACWTGSWGLCDLKVAASVPQMGWVWLNNTHYSLSILHWNALSKAVNPLPEQLSDSVVRQLLFWVVLFHEKLPDEWLKICPSY